MSDYIPLIEKVELVRGDNGETPRVWYRLSLPQRGGPKTGDWVVMVARVHSVRFSGGYKTGERPPGGKEKPTVEEASVERGCEFRLEQREIYVFPGDIEFIEIARTTKGGNA